MTDLSLKNLNLLSICVLVLLALAWPTAADAQAKTLTLQGHVHGQGGKPLAGVLLRVAGATPEFRQETATDASGAFKFGGLQPGKYSLEASLTGFATVQRSI